MASAPTRPLIVVNYKVYAQSTGQRALDLTRAIAKAAQGARADVIACPQAADLRWIAREGGLPVYAQHVDALAPGAGTGWTLAEAVKEAGATGSLLNHAEHRLTLADIGAAIARLRALGLQSIVCTNDVDTSRAAAALAPDFIAIEPPELIGGDVSVTAADPEIVRASVQAVKKVNPNVRVLCGAGVKTGADLAAALKLGSDGVLLASGVVKAADPAAAMRDLLSGLA